MCRERLFQSKIDEKWDEKLQLINENFKCGIENKYMNLAKARVINGRETSNIRYPWIVEIIRVNRPSKRLPVDGKNWLKGPSQCGGSIISRTSINITNHSLCLALALSYF